MTRHDLARRMAATPPVNWTYTRGFCGAGPMLGRSSMCMRQRPGRSWWRAQGLRLCAAGAYLPCRSGAVVQLEALRVRSQRERDV